MFQTKEQIKELQKNISGEIAKEFLEKDYKKVLELEELPREAKEKTIKPLIKKPEQSE